MRWQAGRCAPPRGPQRREPLDRHAGTASWPGVSAGGGLGGASRGEVFLALTQGAEELPALPAAADKNVFVLQHGLDDAQDRLGAQVILAIEPVHRLEDLFLGQAGVAEGGILQAVLVENGRLVLAGEPAVLVGQFIEFGAGVGSGQGDLDAENVQFFGVGDSLSDGLVGLDRQAQHEGAMDRDAKLLAVPGEFLGALDGDAFLDALEDLGVARLVADHEAAQAAVLEVLEGVVGDIGPAAGRPGHADLLQALGDLPRPRHVGGEGVVVEEVLLALREELGGVGNLARDVVGAADPVAMAADGLGPEAENALGGTAASGIDRDVGLLKVANGVLFDLQVALIDVHDPRQGVEVLDQCPLRVVMQLPGAVAVAAPFAIVIEAPISKQESIAAKGGKAPNV